MGTLLLFQIGLDLGFIAIITVLLIERTKQKTQEDVRMSRGLQLLSSKIAIIQDLMDGSESTVKQLTQLLEAKQQDVHETLEEVERHLQRVQESMEKSKSVARLFRDRIPHEEVIERQTTAKYVKAAKLAHQGLSVEDISQQMDIPRGELDLIVKLNRRELVSRDENVWLGEEEDSQFTEPGESPGGKNAASSLEEEPNESQNMRGELKSIEQQKTSTANAATTVSPTQAKQTLIYSSYKRGASIQESSDVKPVVFKKIQSESRF